MTRERPAPAYIVPPTEPFADKQTCALLERSCSVLAASLSGAVPPGTCVARVPDDVVSARSILQRGSEAIVGRVVARLGREAEARDRTSPALKAALRSTYAQYRGMARAGEPLPTSAEAGFRVFSQFDEDGVVLLLLAAAGIGPARFVDIGAGDGVTGSNVANLALNLGFHGLCIDAKPENVQRGTHAFAAHPDTAFFPPVFRQALVTRENVNALVSEAGFVGEIDVLSIDIDGNDYWIWEALTCVSPRIVVVETHPELGMRPIVVPYDAHLAAGSPPEYLGASPAAMTKLARRLGYRLAGANRFGFNLLYLREDVAPPGLASVDLGELLRHDRIRARERLFDAIAHLPFVEV